MKTTKQFFTTTIAIFCMVATAPIAFANTTPIPGVGVVVKKNPGGGASKAITDNDGHFSIQLEEGEYTLELQSAQLQRAVTEIIKNNYPNSKYKFDGGGVQLDLDKGSKLKMMQSDRTDSNRNVPGYVKDFHILVPKGGAVLSATLSWNDAVIPHTTPSTSSTETEISSTLEGNIFVSSGSKIIPITEKIFKSVLEKELLKVGVRVSYTTFKILKGNYSDTKKEYFIIRATDRNLTTKTTIPVIKNIKTSMFQIATDAGTCTCTSVKCAENYGCNADGSGSTCTCSLCSGDCTKTSTNDFGANITSVLESQSKSN